MGDTIALTILGIIVGGALLLLCRRISLWYFRINDAVALLTEVRDQLKKANGEGVGQAAGR